MIDLIATRPQYRAHLDPIWDALPERGDVVVRSRHRTATAALVASHQDLVRARRWGYTRIALLEHGIGQSYGDGHCAYPGGESRDAASLFLSPNETAAAADRAAYPGARVEVIGDPRLDTLPGRVGEEPTVAVSFHWGTERRIPELRSTVDYWRAQMGKLRAALPGIRLVGHAHPLADVDGLFERIGWPFLASFDDVCRQADVYVCDNSSTIFEFASTGRPVVLLNAPWYRRDVELGLRFWAAAHVGRQVDVPAFLPLAIEEALSTTDADTRAREHALSIAYAHRTGAAARGVGVITDWLSEVEQAA